MKKSETLEKYLGYGLISALLAYLILSFYPPFMGDTEKLYAGAVVMGLVIYTFLHLSNRRSR